MKDKRISVTVDLPPSVHTRPFTDDGKKKFIFESESYRLKSNLAGMISNVKDNTKILSVLGQFVEEACNSDIYSVVGLQAPNSFYEYTFTDKAYYVEVLYSGSSRPHESLLVSFSSVTGEVTVMGMHEFSSDDAKQASDSDMFAIVYNRMSTIVEGIGVILEAIKKEDDNPKANAIIKAWANSSGLRNE
jgi:hypothetical protein